MKMEIELLFLLWVSLFCLASAKNCVKVNDCSCEFDDGSGVVDISSIGSTDGTPRFYDYYAAWDLMYYSYNPCHPFSEGECSNAAVCKYDTNLFRYINVGSATKTSYSYDGANVIVEYQSESGFDGSAQVTLVCDQTMVTPQLEAFGDIIGSSQALLTMTAQAACPVATSPSGSGGEGGGLSGGSVLLIIFFVLLVVYLIVGGVFLRMRREARGKDMIPNLTFWSALPSLIKDGFGFVVGKIRGTGSKPDGGTYAAM